ANRGKNRTTRDKRSTTQRRFMTRSPSRSHSRFDSSREFARQKFRGVILQPCVQAVDSRVAARHSVGMSDIPPEGSPRATLPLQLAPQDCRTQRPPSRITSMTRWWLGSLVVLGFLGVGSGALPEKSDAVSPKETVALFNGKDLTGLTTWLKDTKREDPRRVFRVEDGVLHITGDGFGYVATEKAYRDYRVVVEYKW